MSSHRLIAQSRPATTEFETVYTVSVPEARCIITHVAIANTSNADALYSILHVLPGGDQDESSALAWNVKLPANSGSNSHRTFSLNAALYNVGDLLVIKSSIANALTFTFYGIDL